MRLTPEQITKEKEYLREFLEMLWFGEHVLTSAERDLFDTIEALQAENEQLRAQVARMKNALQRYKDHIKSYPCECKFGLDFYGVLLPFRDGEMCERCAELAEIDKATSIGTEG